MRILWLSPDKPENISVGRQQIANHLENKGVEVVLRGTTFRTVLRSFRESKEYDAVIGTTRAGAIAGTILKTLSGIPLIVDHIDPIRQFEETHPRWLSTIVRLLESMSFFVSDHTLYVYEEEEKRVSQHAAEITRTNLGVEYDRFADPDPTVVSEAATRLESLSLDENVAIYVGGLEPIYNISELMDAISAMNDWSLLLLGDGSIANHVRQVAAERDDIAYIGTVPHEVVPGYIHAADVGVSLVDDPNTLKVLEYGAAGLPVVQVSGEAQQRFGEYLNYCEKTTESIAEAIQKAENRNGNDEFQTYVSKFDWKEVTRDYHQALKSVI